MDEQCASLTERAELSRVLKPSPGVRFGRWSGIGDLAMGDIAEAYIVEQRLPFAGAEQVRGRRKLPGPLVGMRAL